MIPADMECCPRCLLDAKYLVHDHLEWCGAGPPTEPLQPKGRWTAAEYLAKPKAEQERMREIEMADVAVDNPV